MTNHRRPSGAANRTGLPQPVATTQAGGGAHPPDVASALRRIRLQNGLSLETLAKLSGVSRAMLGQIETGKSVPTITVVWKVAQALGISATELIVAPPLHRVFELPRTRQRTIVQGNGRFQMRPFVAAEFEVPFTAGELQISGGHRETLPGFGGGARAVLFASCGEIEFALSDGSDPNRLHAGDVILFDASVAHTIFNPAPSDAIAILVTSPPRNRQA